MADELEIYPIVLRLGGVRCLVVGGSTLALQKARALLRAGAHVSVIAPDVSAELAELVSEVRLHPYAPGDAVGFQLVFAATGSETTDRAVATDARAAGIFVNAADELGASTFILPAIARAGAVSVAVSTAGTSPALASYLRDEIAAAIGYDAPFLASVLGETRVAIRARGHSTEGFDWRWLIATLRAVRVTDGDEAARALGRKTAADWAKEPDGDRNRRVSTDE